MARTAFNLHVSNQAQVVDRYLRHAQDTRLRQLHRNRGGRTFNPRITLPHGHHLRRIPLRDEVVRDGLQERFANIGRHHLMHRLGSVRQQVNNLYNRNRENDR